MQTSLLLTYITKFSKTMISKTQCKTERVSYGLSDVSPRDKPWDIHGLERDLVGDSYLSEGYTSYAERILNCSQFLEFAVTSLDKQAITLKLQSARFCRVRYCPVCQWRRSLKWRARFFEVFPNLLEDHPKVEFIFLTLTVKNCVLEELRLTIGEMNKAWNKLVRRRQFPALGWIKSIEVTKSKDSTAHPHFHCLLMVSSDYFDGSRLYVSQPLWRQLWRRSLKVDYDPIVNVRKVKPKVGEEERSGLMAAVCETLKYSVKPSDLIDSSDWLIGLSEQMYKLRAVSVGGVLKSYLSDLGQESDSEDLVHIEPKLDVEGQQQAQCYFSWNRSLKRYMGV